MRIVLIASAIPPAMGFGQAIPAMGHELPALIAFRGPEGRYGPGYPFGLHDAAPGADLVLVSSGRHLAGLFDAYQPDLVFCASFPIKVPDEALAVPRLGVLNMHPALLPRYRGPNPFGWAIRNGDTEIGLTIHRMTSDYDAGPIYAQAALPLAEDEDLLTDGMARFEGVATRLLSEALARVGAGDPGDRQDESQATEAGIFEPDYVEVHWSKPAREIHNQARAWRLSPPVNGRRGALATLEGRRVRLVRTHLTDALGGVRVECGDGPLWIVESEPVAEDA